MVAAGVCCPIFVDDALLAPKDRQADVVEAVLHNLSLHGHQVFIVVTDEGVLAHLESLQLPSARLPDKKDAPVEVSFRIRMSSDARENARNSQLFHRIPSQLDEDAVVAGHSAYQVLGPITVARDVLKRRAETGVNHATDATEPRSQTDARTALDSTAVSRHFSSPQSSRSNVAAAVAGKRHPASGLDTHESPDTAAENSLDAARHDERGGLSDDLPDWWPD
jgi:hypothetical protein